MSEMKVAVVGGGIAGASTAFALARSGAAVTLIDAQQSGQATAAGAGIIQPWTSGLEGSTYDLYAEGAVYYSRLLDELRELGQIDVGYRVTGSVLVGRDSSNLDEAERHARQRVAGIAAAGSVERLDGQQARDLFPPLAHEFQALYVSGGARVDGRLLRTALLDAARKLGAVVERGEAQIVPSQTDTWQVQVDCRKIHADAVVVAAGAWTNDVLAPLGYRVAVQPQRGQIVHLHLNGVDTSRWPSVAPLHASHYLVSFDAGRVVIGATREAGTGFDPRVTASGLHEILGNALAVAPGLAAATVVETRVGLRPLPDGESPFIGAVPGIPNLYANAGFGGGGLTMGPLAGAALAQLVTTGSSDFDLTAFAPPEARG